MRRLWLIVLLFAVFGAGVVLGVTDARPRLSRPAHLSMADLEKGRAVIQALGLRHIRDGESRQLVVAETDLDRGVNYLAARLAGGSASAGIEPDRLLLRASLPLSGLGRHLNLELALAPAGDRLVPDRLRLGRLEIPAPLSGPLIAFALARLPHADEIAAGRDMLDSARLQGKALELRFTWRSQALEKAMSASVGAGGDEAVLQAYRQHLAKIRTRDFALLLGAAFDLARRRGGNPVIENRAALTVLAEAVLGNRLLTRNGLAIPRRHGRLHLAGRGDFAQHFALSAFISAAGGREVSDLAGLYKELRDSRHGSGFSFTDLAADRAGSRLGEQATRSATQAGKTRDRLAGGRDASSYFPALGDLPEFMSEAEFHSRFGGVGAPAYQRMMEEIERRIGALALYRD